MSETEQAVIFLKLRRELSGVKNELVALDASIKDCGMQFIELGNFIIDSPGIGQDWETIKQTVNDLPKKLARLSELQNAKADLDARLSKFDEPFADPK